MQNSGPGRPIQDRVAISKLQKWRILDVKVFKIFENTGPIASYLTFAVTNQSFKSLMH